MPSVVIDLDHNATTPLEPAVRSALIEALEGGRLGGNPSSLHTLGRRARGLVEEARREVAAAVGAATLDVVFTSGGTEADALAILGTTRALRAAGEAHGLATLRIEHPAVLGAAKQASREGSAVRWIPTDQAGRVDPARLEGFLREATEVGLVSIAVSHHETGVVQDLRALVEAVRLLPRRVLVHTDAVQALGKLPLGFVELDLDLMSLSAHKFGGPRGAGALVVKRGTPLAPLVGEGVHERGMRPGTEASLSVLGMGVAARVVRERGLVLPAHVASLCAELEAGLVATGGVEIVGATARRVGNTIAAVVHGAPGELVLMALDLEGIAVSTGAACSSGVTKVSSTLLALGYDEEAARGLVRLSLGAMHGPDDIARVLEVWPVVVARVRAAAPALDLLGARAGRPSIQGRGDT